MLIAFLCLTLVLLPLLLTVEHFIKGHNQPAHWSLGSADRGACGGRARAGDLEGAGATAGRTLDFTLRSLDFILQLMSWEGFSG